MKIGNRIDAVGVHLAVLVAITLCQSKCAVSMCTAAEINAVYSVVPRAMRASSWPDSLLAHMARQ